MPEEKSVKILFRFYSDILDEETTETLSAEEVDKEYGYYKLLTIPFYAPKVALGDVVWAEYSYTEGTLAYRKTVKHSGNSTIHAIVIKDDFGIELLRRIFEGMGCSSAKLNHQYFAIEVPAAVDYFPVKRKLDELEKEKIIDYAESGLSDKHQYKNISFL